MSTENKEIVLGFLNDVINRKQVNRIEFYFGQHYATRGAPYVGLGIFLDASSSDKLVITCVHPGSPADGLLLVGDEIKRVEDDQNTWVTFDEINKGSWGLGIIGTNVHIDILRQGKPTTVMVSRGLVEDFKITYDLIIENYKKYLLEDYPDLTASVVSLVAEGDLVAYFLKMQGTDAAYKRQAIWTDCGFFRIVKGKIVEGWGCDDEFSRKKQLGYQIYPPVI